MKKYYFVVYQTVDSSKIIFNSVISIHPLHYIKYLNKISKNQDYNILFYAEITKEMYEVHKDYYER